MEKKIRPTHRELVHEATLNEILQEARQQIAADGAAALSLRAIARAVGVTAPALYRYFKNRDELVTALIVEAYKSLAQTLEAVRDAIDVNHHAQRLLDVIMAYRAWALAHPQDYALVFGTPIPGYVGPVNVIVPVAKRVMDIFVDLLAASQADQFQPSTTYRAPSLSLQTQLAAWKEKFGYTSPTTAMHLALIGWSRLHGLIALELFEHIPPFFGDMTELYRSEAIELLKAGGLSTHQTWTGVSES
jgi:AcrR family transcriptional regulator